MSNFDFDKFFQKGLLFSPEDSGKLAKFMDRFCLGVGLAAGMGLGLAAFGDISRAGGAYRDGRWILIGSVAGFAVGGVAGTLACDRVKTRIVEFLEPYFGEGATAAVAALTSSKRTELQEEARKILDVLHAADPEWLKQKEQENDYLA
jgi:hypothetical protein